MDHGIDAGKALEHWHRQGLLSEEKVRELEAGLDDLREELRKERSNRGIVVFATVGAVLVGLGIVLFIGSNWRGLGPVSRGTVLLAIYAAIVAGAAQTGRRGYGRLSEALWFLATLSFGANVFFLGQIFHHTLTWWQGPLVWLAGVLAMGFARRRRVYGHAAVPLLLLFLGWLGGGAGWFVDDQVEFLFSPRGLRPLLPLLGVGLVSASLLLTHRDDGRPPGTGDFLVRPFRGWGLLLITVPLIIASADPEAVAAVFDAAWTAKQWFLTALALVLAGSALAVLRSTPGRVVLAAVLALTAAPLVAPAGASWLGAAAEASGAVFFLFVVAVFALALLTVWVGLQVAQKALVNAGMATLAVLIFVQYFALSFGLFHRSLVFVVGGLLLMALAFGLERARRRLLDRLEER